MATRRNFLKAAGAAPLGALLGTAVAAAAEEDPRSAAAGLKLDVIDHAGFIVKDRDSIIESWTSMFGLGPWKTVEIPAGPMRKMSWVKVGATQLELLEPREEKSVWFDYLEEHGDGLHHLCTLSDDVEGDVKRMVAQGAEFMIGFGGFAYVKTKGYGDLILELLERRGSARNTY